MIFDTHCHYDDSRFSEDRDELILSLPGKGVTRFVNVCADYADLDAVLAVADRYEGAYAALGIHPSEVGELTEVKLETLKEKLLTNKKVVAVGEIGLDRYEENPDYALQEYWFRRQLSLARETGFPVIIHSRDSAADTRRIIEEEHVGDLGGVVHCFSYSVEDALYYSSLGLYIGVGGVVTFKNARKLKDVVAALPLESIVLETDCPYLAPVPHRGERNSSLFLPYVVRAVAELKGISEEETERVTFENACRLYRLSPESAS
ncbi:MAG: TatD family hydrolase [Lachnospiraceae bacterium]|nr:TatD family hydrolase [Lachnospiraceae bacterium]